MTVEQYQERTQGITLLGERDPRRQAAAFAVLLPAGPAFDPPGRRGAARALQAYLMKGAGGLSARELMNRLDSLGISHQAGAEMEHIYFAAACLPGDLPEAVRLFGKILCDPSFPADGFEEVRRRSLAGLRQREDVPMGGVMTRLAQAYFGAPLGNPAGGERDDLKGLTREDLVGHHAATYRRGGLVAAAAGHIDWPAFRAAALEAFGRLPEGAPPPPPTRAAAPQRLHIQKETAQVHIGFAWPSVARSDPRFTAAQLAVGVLSGGMGASLFQRVRERHGLVYNVRAAWDGSRRAGGILGYAGTTPERAQHTLDVVLEVLGDTARGVEEAEVERARVRLKTGLATQVESATGRAVSLSLGQFLTGQVQSVAERLAEYARVGVHDVNAYWQEIPPRDFTIVTIGPRALEVRA